MIFDIGKISTWDASKHKGTVLSDATSRKYTVEKRAFGRIPREPIVGDIVTIDKLLATNPSTIEKARIRGLVPKESSSGIWLLLALIALAIVLWKTGLISSDSFAIVHTTTPKTIEAPSLLGQ